MDGLYVTFEKLMGDVLYKFKYVHNLEKNVSPWFLKRELQLQDCGKARII